MCSEAAFIYCYCDHNNQPKPIRWRQLPNSKHIQLKNITRFRKQMVNYSVKFKEQSRRTITILTKFVLQLQPSKEIHISNYQ